LKLIKFNEFYLKYFNEISPKLNFPIKITEFCYKNDNLIIEYNKLNEKYKNIDILIINSIPLSYQYNFNITDWNNFIYKVMYFLAPAACRNV
jgi:hypothetical protein